MCRSERYLLEPSRLLQEILNPIFNIISTVFEEVMTSYFCCYSNYSCKYDSDKSKCLHPPHEPPGGQSEQAVCRVTGIQIAIESIKEASR